MPGRLTEYDLPPGKKVPPMRSLLTRVGLYALAASLLLWFARYIWVLGNIETLWAGKYVGPDSVRLFLLLDPWTGRLIGAIFWPTALLALLAAAPLRRVRYRLVEQQFNNTDNDRPTRLSVRMAAWILWFPPILLLFAAGILISRLADFDAPLSPFSDIPVFGSFQRYLLGPDGVLRGAKGAVRWVARYFWVHPVDHLDFWCWFGAISVLGYRVFIDWPWESKGSAYRALLRRCGRCPVCQYRIVVSDTHICSECGAVLDASERG